MENNQLGKEKQEEMLQSMYDEINSMQQAAHEQNQKWIHLGLRAMLIVPWLFMFFMFWAPSGSKLVFLVLWIVSMFTIAIFLIGVEYSDYLLQKKWLSMSGNSHEEIQALTVLPPTGPVANAVLERREKRLSKNESDYVEQQNCLYEEAEDDIVNSEQKVASPERRVLP